MIDRILDACFFMIDNMINIIASIIILAFFTLGGGCVYKGFDDIDYIKERAEQRWNEYGFEVVDSNGYEMGYGFIGTNYGSAKVWYHIRKVPDNGIIYTGYLFRWGDEIHVYGPRAVDAIKPNS